MRPIRFEKMISGRGRKLGKCRFRPYLFTPRLAFLRLHRTLTIDSIYIWLMLRQCWVIIYCKGRQCWSIVKFLLALYKHTDFYRVWGWWSVSWVSVFEWPCQLEISYEFRIFRQYLGCITIWLINPICSERKQTVRAAHSWNM